MLEGFHLIDGFDLEDLKWYIKSYDIDINCETENEVSPLASEPPENFQSPPPKQQDPDLSQGPNNFPAGTVPNFAGSHQLTSPQGYHNFNSPSFSQYPYNMYHPHAFKNMSPIAPWIQTPPPGYTNMFFKEKEVNIPK